MTVLSKNIVLAPVMVLLKKFQNLNRLALHKFSLFKCCPLASPPLWKQVLPSQIETSEQTGKTSTKRLWEGPYSSLLAGCRKSESLMAVEYRPQHGKMVLCWTVQHAWYSSQTAMQQHFLHFKCYQRRIPFISCNHFVLISLPWR